MTTAFRQQFTTIKGLSDRRRLPRLGKIRLGFKLKKGTTEYPAELPFFLLPPEIAAAYGFKDQAVAIARAKELGCTRADVLTFIGQNYSRMAEEIDIMFPVNDRSVVFPTAYKWYGWGKGVRCMGDGERAVRMNEATRMMEERECPCEILKTEKNPKGECTQRAHLLVMVPKISMGGIYQIDCGSVNSIIDMNSSIDYVAAMTNERFALIMLKLRRKPIETHHAGTKQVHFTMQALFNVNIDDLNALREGSQRVMAQTATLVLPPPEDINPEMDTDGPTMEIEGEPKPEQAETAVVPTAYELAVDAIISKANVKTLATLWADITKKMAVNVFTPEEYQKLAALKDKRKAEI
mgnify:FL=1